MSASQSEPGKGLIARPPEGVTFPKDYVPLAESHHALYQVTTEAFQGPLDLLLFLIRRHQLDIFDIPMAFVCSRYLEILERSRDNDLDVAAEFLFMASELVHIKSRLLLPKEAKDDDEADEGDPRTELVTRLLLLQSFQDAARELDARPQLGRDVFCGEPEMLPKGLRPLRSLDPMALVSTLDQLIRKQAPQARHQVVVEQVPMRSHMARLLSRLDEQTSGIGWPEVFAEVDTRLDLIVMFLAVLELAKQHLVQLAENERGELFVAGAFSSLGDAQQRVAGADLEAAFA